MPSKSRAQSRFMTANCKSDKFRRKTGMSKKVACDFHKADKGKYHETVEVSDINVKEMAGNKKTKARKDKAEQKTVDWTTKFRRDMDKITSTGERAKHYVGGGQPYTKGKTREETTMNDETINEKVKLQHALKTEDGDDTEFRADDIGRMKKLAGINQKLDTDKEQGVVNFDGIFTGVANGEIPVSEGNYSFLKSLDEGKKKDGDGDIDDDDYLAAKDNAIKKSMKKESTELDEYAKDEDEDKFKGFGDKKKAKKDVDESELNRIYKLAGITPRITEYHESEDDMIRFCVDSERAHQAIMSRFGEEIEHDGEDMLIPENLWGKIQEVAWDNDGEATEVIEVRDMDHEPMGSHDMSNDAEALASAGLGTDEDYGYYGESEMFPKGSLSRTMIEMIVDEMNKGKKAEEISEELSFDVDHVAKVVEFVKAKHTPVNEEETEEVDEGKKKDGDDDWTPPWKKDDGADKEEVDEAEETEEVDEDLERLKELSGLAEDSESYLANRDKAIKERIAAASNKEELDETGDEEVGDEHTVYCSSCGGEFRHGKKTGFSHCDDHASMKNYDLGEDIKESGRFGVFSKGGSIGTKNDKPIKTFSTKEEAKAKARSMRKTLTKGERGHYKMGYVVKSVSESSNEINEDETGDEEVDEASNQKPKMDLDQLQSVPKEEWSAFAAKHGFQDPNDDAAAADDIDEDEFEVSQSSDQQPINPAVSEFDDEDDNGPESYLSQEACNEASNMFLDAVSGKLGGMIGEQARSICRNGEPFEEQNANALRYIAEYASANGLEIFAREIEQYLSDEGRPPMMGEVDEDNEISQIKRRAGLATESVKKKK